LLLEILNCWGTSADLGTKKKSVKLAGERLGFSVSAWGIKFSRQYKLSLGGDSKILNNRKLVAYKPAQ